MSSKFYGIGAHFWVLEADETGSGPLPRKCGPVRRIHVNHGYLVGERWIPFDDVPLFETEAAARDSAASSLSHLASGIRRRADLEAPARLITPKGVIELRYPDELVIGRDASCALVLEDPAVSRQHARIVVRADEIVILDSSTNGVYVNDVRVVGEARLEPGARIRLGETELSLC